MKKFNYKKWVTENKHGSLNEQTQVLESGSVYQLAPCNSGQGNFISQCIPNSFFGGSPAAVGHTLNIGLPPHPGNQGGEHDMYITAVQSSCFWYEPYGTAYPTNVPTPAQINPGPLNSCPNNTITPIPGPSTGSQCPGCNGGQHTWGNFNNWINTINNHPVMTPGSNPNQPCQFINNRIAHWTNQQQGINNCQTSAWYNQLACKIKHFDATLSPQYGC